MNETIWKVSQIIVWLLVGTAWYFGDSNAMKERVAVLETKLEQESLGYSTAQMISARRVDRLEEVLDERLNKMDRKLDCLINRSMCR